MSEELEERLKAADDRAQARATLRQTTEMKANLVRQWEEQIAQLMDAGLSARMVALDAGVSHVTVYRIAKAYWAGREKGL